MAERHPSAVKRHRQNLKKRERNRAVRSHLRRTIRKARELAAAADPAAAEEQVRVVVKELSKAVSKGVLHKNAASRRIARLSRQVAARKKVATAAGTS